MVSELPHTIDVIVTLQVQSFRGIGDNVYVVQVCCNL